jgi:16S rRNA (guanine966-N2)-methyltransferase
MRIIAGKNRGRNLIDCKKLKSLRPTTDNNRENLFNIINFSKAIKEIGFELQNTDLLDVFCGSGSISFEALSRGIKSASLIDNNFTHLAIAKENAELLKEKNIEFIQTDILKPLFSAKKQFDFIYIDPPYSENMALKALENIESSGWIKNNALIVIEHALDEKMDFDKDKFRFLDMRKYGITTFTFLTKSDYTKI